MSNLLRRLLSQQVSRRCFSTKGPDGTYYNSQLGQHIRISGAAGIRMHDLSLAQLGWSSELLTTVCNARPTSIDVGDVESLSDDQIGELAVAVQVNSDSFSPSSGFEVSAWVKDMAMLKKWGNVHDIRHKASTICLSCRAENLADELEAGVKLVQASHDAGMQVKARVQDAFTDVDGDAVDPYEVHDMVLGLADAGADVLVVTDTHARATEDEVVGMVEALLWFDVSGESMMERLGFRGSEEGSLAAARLGVTHFEAAVTGERESGLVGGKRLAAALEEAGKKVSLAWRDI